MTTHSQVSRLIDEVISEFTGLEEFWFDEGYADVSAFTLMRAIKLGRDLTLEGYTLPSYIEPSDFNAVTIYWDFKYWCLVIRIPPEKHGIITMYGDCGSKFDGPGYILHASYSENQGEVDG